MKYFDHKSFFYCHCGFSLQRTETFHKVFDADDDVEVIYIGMCVIIHGNNNKITKNKPREEEEKIHKKSQR